MVEDKCFLVNLNADPALNELLVYYLKVTDTLLFTVHVEAESSLKQTQALDVTIVLWCFQEHTRVGSADSQDIQLCGMAIQAEHCVIGVTQNSGVVLTPHRNARYVVRNQSWLTFVEMLKKLQYHQDFRGTVKFQSNLQ